MAGTLLRALATSVGIPVATFNDVSQAGHLLAGLCAVFGPVAFARCSPNALWWGFGGACAVTLWAALKEGIYDRYFETEDVRGSSWEDYSFYVGPAWFALLVLAAVTWL
jgi:hypothetical protein